MGLAWDQLPMPTALLVSLGDVCLRGRRGGRERRWLLPRGRACRVLCFEAFTSLLQVGISGEGFSRKFISFPGTPFQGQGLHSWSVTGQGVVSHRSWPWRRPPGSAASLGLELKHN